MISFNKKTSTGQSLQTSTTFQISPSSSSTTADSISSSSSNPNATLSKKSQLTGIFSQEEGASRSRGYLWIKLLSIRGLPPSLGHCSPFCVVEMERNEVVTKVANRYDGFLGAFIWDICETTFDCATSHTSFTISIYVNNPSSPSEQTFVGQVSVYPQREHNKFEDIWMPITKGNFINGQQQPQPQRNSMDLDMGEGVSNDESDTSTSGSSLGEVRIQYVWRAVHKNQRFTADDFEILKVIGKGSFGKVLQVRKIDTGRIYAMKVLSKADIVRRKEVEHTLAERNVLIQASYCPFLVNLKFSFQTPEKLYLVLDYMNGGELFYHLQHEVAFSEARAKFYTAELILALQHLHRHGIVYRDLKPENVLLDCNGHIVLVDFGLCKENLTSSDQTTNTFCGTSEYIAPEVLKGEGYGKAVDWWSLGILFYEMTTGLPPFYSENTNLMYKKILHNTLTFPENFSLPAQSLVRGFLNRDPRLRLGGGPEDAEEVKRHEFFRDVDWSRLWKKSVVPPFKPKVESETDTSNFDPAFTSALPVDSLSSTNESPLSEAIQENFRGFTYTNESNYLEDNRYRFSSSINNNTNGNMMNNGSIPNNSFTLSSSLSRSYGSNSYRQMGTSYTRAPNNNQFFLNRNSSIKRPQQQHYQQQQQQSMLSYQSPPSHYTTSSSNSSQATIQLTNHVSQYSHMDREVDLHLIDTHDTDATNGDNGRILGGMVGASGNNGDEVIDISPMSAKVIDRIQGDDDEQDVFGHCVGFDLEEDRHGRQHPMEDDIGDNTDPMAHMDSLQMKLQNASMPLYHSMHHNSTPHHHPHHHNHHHHHHPYSLPAMSTSSSSSNGNVSNGGMTSPQQQQQKQKKGRFWSTKMSEWGKLLNGGSSSGGHN